MCVCVCVCVYVCVSVCACVSVCLFQLKKDLDVCRVKGKAEKEKADAMVRL